MLPAISAYLAKQYLDWSLKGAIATQPANVWAGLAAGTPTNVSGSEIAAAVYNSRVTALFGAAASPAGSASNTAYWNLPDDEATTVAGLVIHEARSIPEVGQSFTFHGFRFRVLRRARNRITALRIQPLPRT